MIRQIAMIWDSHFLNISQQSLKGSRFISPVNFKNSCINMLQEDQFPTSINKKAQPDWGKIRLSREHKKLRYEQGVRSDLLSLRRREPEFQL
jgi:hypothetical protein